MRVYKLRLHPDKMEVLLVEPDSALGGDYDLKVAGVALPRKNQLSSQGVLLALTLLLDKQIAAVARGLFYQLQLVCQLHPFLEKKDQASVTLAVVTSRLY